MTLDARSLLIAYDGSSAAAVATRAAGVLFPGARAIVLTVHSGATVYEHAGAAARIGLADDVIAGGIAALVRAEAERAAATAAEGADLALRAGLDGHPATAAAASPWHEIHAAAGRGDADVIVCGTSGRAAFSRAVLGSTSMALLHHADRPVVVVADGAGDLGGPLVVGYDGSDAARRAVAAAGRLFKGRDAIVVHVWESPVRSTHTGRAIANAPLPEIREVTQDLHAFFADGARELAEEGAALATEHGLRARPEAVEAGSGAWRGLLSAARTADAAVVVVGSRGRGGIASVVLGSVSSGLVHNADLPVLVVPD
jgi:nucleotide-binding universal stress UspA family protein